MKQLLTILLLSFCPMIMNAEEISIEEGYLTFTINTETKTAKVSSCNKDNYPESIDIPQTIVRKGEIYKVTEIGYMAFMSRDKLVSITIPEGVTTIAWDVFYGCI